VALGGRCDHALPSGRIRNPVPREAFANSPRAYDPLAVEVGRRSAPRPHA